MRMRTLAFVAGTAALLAACGGGSKSTSSGGSSGTGGSTGGACTAAQAGQGQCACTADTDCPTGYTCDTEQTKTCIFQCQSAADCTADYAPADKRTTCQSAALGCTCDFDPSTGLSVCSTKGCGTDADCPSGVCQSGQCVGNPTSTVAACSVFPEYQVMNSGQAVTFHVQAYADAAKTTPLRTTDADTTWSVAGGAPLTNTGAVFTAGSASSGTEVAGVQASVNGKTCTATVKVYPAASGMRVVVIDALAGVALSGATVQVDSATATTDNDGIATGFTGLTGTTHTVSVFMNGFDYVTVVGTSATDILIPITRNDDVNQGGVKGTVPDLFQANSKIHAGFVGMSIAGSITDLSTGVLIGPLQPLCDNPNGCSVGGTSLPSDVKVPSGVMLGLNDQSFKSNYAALGSAGWCSDATKVANGTCATRGIWALAGDIDIDKISPVIDQISGGGGLSNINIGGVLTSLLPVLRDFNSIIVRDQDINLGPTTTDSSGDKVVDPQFLTAKNLTIADASTTTRLSLKMTVHIPQLPHDPNSTDPNKCVDGAVVLGASDVPGRGIFPLGLTAGVDNTGTQAAPVTDCHVSYQDELGTNHQDEVQLNMAPNHDGTESGQYRMAIVASSFSNITSGIVGSGIVVNPGQCSASNLNGVCYGANITYGSTFMDFPSTAAHDYASRTLTVGTVPSGTALMRMDFHDDAGHRWFVYFPPSMTTVQVPAPASGFEDRTRANDTSTGARSMFLLLAFDLGQATADDAMTFGSGAASLQKLDRFIQRFSIKDYPPPTIDISSPTAGSTVQKSGGQVTVKIAADDQNQNKWVLCANNSTTAIGAGDLASCTAGGAVDTSGQGVASLPANTPTGSGVVLHAVLTDSTGNNLLDPSVESTVSVTVQ